MSKKQKVQETIFNGSQYGADGWPPEDPAGFLAWFQERIERIPVEDRASAKIEISTQIGYYGDSSANLEITYKRDETDGQYAARLRREKEERQKRADREKALLAELLNKHGAP